MNSTMKRCPFCGARATSETACTDREDLVFAVGCDNGACPVKPMTSFYSTLAEAINKWNGRA